MARTIKEIQNEMIGRLRSEVDGLSDSKVAEWRLWTYIVAVAIHAFEVILDLFRQEVETLTNSLTPGTDRWYAEMALRYQYGHELVFDENTCLYYYAEDDPDSRIVKMATVDSTSGVVSVKVAKFDEDGNTVQLDPEELLGLTGYMTKITFAGLRVDVVSTVPDLIRYNIEAFYDPIVPEATVREGIVKALADYRAELSFDSKLYAQTLIGAAMSVEGVVTASLRKIERKGLADEDFAEFDAVTVLSAGYYDYSDDCTLTLTNIRTL